MGTITIRPATIDDVPLLLRFIEELATFVGEPEAARATETLLQESLFGARAYAEALIASLDGESCGMAVFFHNFSTWTGHPGLYLEDLYVTPAARGAGVGKVLMARLAALARQRGCARFEWGVLASNVQAAAFYQRLGAQHLNDFILTRLDGEALGQLADVDHTLSE